MRRRFVIEETGEEFEAETYKQAHLKLCTRLAVEGPRTLKATTEDGGEVVASLYSDEDLITYPSGRKLVLWRRP